MLSHAFEQWVRLGGFGELLEDDLKHLHQILKSISECTSHIKCKEMQAIVHSKLEHKLHNQEIKAAITNHRMMQSEPLKSDRWMPFPSTI
jgi:hypothetical protein